MKIAIVYDWIDKWGGVERLLLDLHKIYPDAPFYTSYYDVKHAQWAKNLRITPSFLQKFPGFVKKNRIFSLVFFPYIFESFDFSEYDIVISITSSFAKSIITKPSTKHLCIVLTPTRYFWGQTSQYLSPLKKILFAPLLNKLREWDYIASKRPDQIISISNEVKSRVLKYYTRDSEVLYPPFDIDYWESINKKIDNVHEKENSQYYLVVSRFESYKRINLVIETFNNLPNKKLIIVGKGSLEKKLKSIANNNIIFLKNIDDTSLAKLYKNAEALIMPQEEDFGYTSLESQFFNCPVLSFNKGGAKETIIENRTGLFFNEQTPESLRNCIKNFEAISDKLHSYLKENSMKHLEKFSTNKFRMNLIAIVSHIADSTFK